MAHYWGKDPWEFRSLLPDQKAELLALYIVKQEVDGYYKAESMRDMEPRDKNQAKGLPRKPTQQY